MRLAPRSNRFVVVCLTATLLLGSCNRQERAEALRTKIPERETCAVSNEEATPERPLQVRVVRLCADGTYGDYGIAETHFVARSDRSAVELAVRELLECCPNRAEDLISVTVVHGTATLNFPAGYETSYDWNNVSTSAGNLAFFPPLVETMFQFPEVQRIASSFGGVGWWPLESDYGEFDRTSFRVPMRPLPLDRTSPVAAIPYVADGLRDEYGDEDWYDTIRLITANPSFIFVETAIDPLDEVTATKVELAIDELLDRDRTRWCHVLIGINGHGKAIGSRTRVPRCDTESE